MRKSKTPVRQFVRLNLRRIAYALCLLAGSSRGWAASASPAGAPPPAATSPATTNREAADDAREGEGSGDSTEALAKAAQNPVANLISVPFQNNFNHGIGPNDVTQWVLNFQPVIPVTLNKDWNLITRTIIPTINQPSPASGVPSAFGLGDINPTAFLSPAHSGKLIWGVGPTFTFPTATDPLLGAGKWSAGPAVVALTICGHWVAAALANNQWSFAGWGDKDVNAMLIQPFINYNLKHGWALSFAPIITANWDAPSGQQWTVPLGLGVSKTTRFQRRPIQLGLQYYRNVEHPDAAAASQLRFVLSLLFPTAPPPKPSQ